MEEPSMLVQRPSSNHSQKTSHILFSTFRDVFVQNNISNDTVKNLSVSKRGENDYHDKYVENLQAIHEKWSQKISAIDHMINHLDQAKEQARNLEKQEEEKAKSEYNLYAELGLPSVSSKLHEFIDSNLLRENNLIVPEDFLRYDTEKPTDRKIQDGSKSPQFRNSTLSSKAMFNKIPQEDNYLPENEPILPPRTKVFNETKRIHKRKTHATASSSEKNIWRNCMAPKQRDEEKKKALKLQTRADFLKNPRFEKNPKQLTISDKFKDRVPCFEMDPCPVIFTDYEVGKTYEMKLDLRNVTASSRQVRLLPPSTQYFSLSQGEFPSENGLVAPGMSCFYTLRFCPTSLADYDDALQVKSQDSEPLLVPLRGRRQPPDLTLPRDLNCGFGLVGSCKTKEYVVKNLRGPGRFCFSDDKDSVLNWDEMNFKGENFIELQPFSIKPARFQLDTNETVVVKVFFQPKQVKNFSCSVNLLCDNCCSESHNVSGSAEIAQISLHDVEGGTVVPQLGETYDESAKKLIVFNDAHPGVIYTKEIQIKNCVSVPLHFNWIISFPSVGTVACKNESKSEKINKESTFKIEPSVGYLMEQSVTTFNVVFTPQYVDNWFDIASLVLKDIPTLKETVFENEDVTHLKFSIKGYAQHFSVVAEPPIVMMSGKFYVGIEYYRTVKLHNKSREGTTFRWEQMNNEECDISIEPKQGRIGPNTSIDFLITIIGKKVGMFDVRLPYHSPFVDQCRSLYVQCMFTGPKVVFEENDVTFGLVRLGTNAEREIKLINETPIEASWKLGMRGNQNIRECIVFSLTNGILPPNSQHTIYAKFFPRNEMTFHGFLQCAVEGGKTSHLPVHGEVQRPHVYTQQTKVNIEEAFINIPVKRTITFCNTTLLKTRLHFVKCIDSQCSVTVEKSSVELDGLEKYNMELTFIFNQLGEFDSCVFFQVDEMLEPIVFAVNADVKGLIIDVSVPNIQDLEMKCDTIRNNDVIDFGEHVILGQPTDALVVIENKSAIDTSFDLYFKHFPCARVPTPPTLGSPLKGVRGKSIFSRPLLKKTSNIGNPKSRTEEQARKEFSAGLLCSGKGLGLTCTPSSATLGAFEQKIITVTAYSDMWGRYNDILVCRVGEDEFEHLIPLSCDVMGSPLNFQMMAKEQPPFVRFGSHPSSGSVVTRKMRINNTSYVDIRLDWETFVIEQFDEKLIDMNCFYGNIFPLRDQDGNEILEDENSAIDSDEGSEEDNDEEGLVTITLSEHQGKKCSIPFNIINKQMVVPSQSHGTVEVIFIPPAGIIEEKNYLGYALGHMSLKNKDREDGGRFQRAHKLDMLPFGLNMTGCVKPAKLFLEACDEEAFFELSAIDLIDANDPTRLKENVASTHRYVIRNISGATVSFTCLLPPPFHLISTNKERLTDHFTLKPNKSMEIHIAFVLTRELVTLHDGGAILRIEKNMVIEFDNNKTTQSYSLLGIVNYPLAQTSQRVVDFGTCLVGEARELNLHISNVSKAVLCWNLVKDEQCPSASKNAFTIHCSHGTIGSIAEENTEHSIDVRLGFLAKHNVEYECIIILSSDFRKTHLDDVGQQIVVRGKGSYDEATKEHFV